MVHCPGRHVPGQAAGAVHLRGKVHDPAARDGLLPRNRRPIRPGCDVCGSIRRLAAQPLNARVTHRFGKGQHRDVPVVIRHHLRLRQRALEAERAFDVGFGRDDLLHGQVGRDPRAAAAAPAGVVVHVHLQAQPVRLGADVLEQAAPQRAAKRRVAFGRALVHLHDQHAADADALHRFEVRGDAVAGDVAVQPEPIDPRPGGVGGMGEASLQFVRASQVRALSVARVRIVNRRLIIMLCRFLNRQTLAILHLRLGASAITSHS